DRVMPNQAVVPKGNGVIFPTEAATELGPHSMLVNVIQQRCTFGFRPALEAFCIAGTYIEGFAPCVRMFDDDWMHRNLRTLCDFNRILCNLVSRVRMNGPESA